MYNQRTSISMQRASLWKEEAAAAAESRSSTALKRPGEDLTADFIEKLEDAVKKRKLMGFETSELPPILSSESLFTKAIPLGMENMMYCRSPWNRIGIYNSPSSMDLGTLDVFFPKYSPPEVPLLRFDLPRHVRRKRPWRNPDGKPSDLSHPYRVPLLMDEDLDFLEEFDAEAEVLPENAMKRGNFYCRSNNLFLKRASDCGLSPGEKLTHPVKSHLKIVKDTDKSIQERKDESVRRDLNDKEKYFPHVVQSPRSLHICTCLRHPPLSSSVSDAAERIVKYQYYIEAGIDESFIAPIRESWVENAVHLVGKKAIQGLSQETVSLTLRHVSEEVHHEYILSMRKAIIDYILQDTVERDRLGLADIDRILQVVTTSYFARSHTIQVLLPEWRSAVLKAHGAMEGTLYRLHPLTLEIASIWQNSFASRLFFNIFSADFRTKMPFDLHAFALRQNQCASSTKDALEKEWFLAAGNLLKQAVPISPSWSFEGFYETIAVLMVNQIRKLVEESIISLTRFLNNYTCKTTDSVPSDLRKHIPTAGTYERLFEEANQDFSNPLASFVPPFNVVLKYSDGVYRPFDQIQRNLCPWLKDLIYLKT